jgi:4-aminobutyrate aminotransferase/(S)-3-amino-2-methylpropionate transaminase
MATTRSIDVRTEIPGPRSREIMARLTSAVASPLAVNMPIVAHEAHGALLTDVDGNTFLDFTGGVGVLNVGHTHPLVVAAAQEQLSRFAHTDFTIVPYEVYVELAERLVAVSPFAGPAKAAFFNSGAEAVENAVKIARLATGRTGVIAFSGAFHGRTLMAVSLTSKVHPYKAGLGPFSPEVYRAPYPNGYRGPDAAAALAELEAMFETQVAPENVAAIVFEPQQGEGGFVPAPQAFVEGLRRIADEHGIVLVADEVQTGFARTGRMFAMEHFGVEPDLITVAKSIAGGLPLSA